MALLKSAAMFSARLVLNHSPLHVKKTDRGVFESSEPAHTGPSFQVQR
jgi:hypothetical protein